MPKHTEEEYQQAIKALRDAVKYLTSEIIGGEMNAELLYMLPDNFDELMVNIKSGKVSVGTETETRTATVCLLSRRVIKMTDDYVISEPETKQQP